MLVRVETPTGEWTTTELDPTLSAMRRGMLVDPLASGARGYDIRPAAGGMRICAFATGGVNGKTPDDTALGNLLRLSEETDVPLALYAGGALPTYFNGATLIGTAHHGIGRMAD